MSQNGFEALNVIKTPVWLISPVSEEIVFANVVATQLMGDKTLDQLRKASIRECKLSPVDVCT
jgi:hypothetical protein